MILIMFLENNLFILILIVWEICLTIDAVLIELTLLYVGIALILLYGL